VLFKIKAKINILYFFGKDNLISLLTKKPTILPVEDTVNKIIESRCSVSRFGDGEFHLLLQNKDLKFQQRSNELSKRLKEVLVSEEENLLICIPKVFTSQDLIKRTQKSKAFWKDHVANYRLLWYRHLKNDKTYYDSTFTRNYIAINDKSKTNKYFERVKEIWRNRDLLIIEGRFSRLGVGNILFDNVNSIERIIAPNEDAFNSYIKILEEAKRHDRNRLVLIALGPTATILAYDLHKLGFQAIDIGHLDIEFEWYLKKSLTRTKIENKYVIEANNPIKEDNFVDENYQKQIIANIL
jgi:glycosyltransferase family protein